MQANNSLGTFATFLNTLNEKQTTDTSAPSAPLVILRTIDKHQGTVPLLVLTKETNLDFPVFKNSIDTLVKSGLISLSGESMDQSVVITATGLSLIR
jgi:hypothetical protein